VTQLSSSRKPRILILSASAGAGHVRAAEALMQDFQQHPAVQDGGHVEHWDTLTYTTRAFRHLYSRVYLRLVNKAPKLLGYVYEKTDTPWENGATRAIEKFNAGKFISALARFKPDILVCTHFTPAAIISQLFEEKKIAVRPSVVVTDLDCHAMWLVKNHQHYFVALPETAYYIQRLGIDPSRISVTGVPIDPIFRRPRRKHTACVDLGLDPTAFTVLVSAGGFGVGPVAELIREIQQMKTPVQVVAIAGRSEKLKAQLQEIADTLAANPANRHRLAVVGFTKKMDEYMAAADILISKPGGLTTSEAMARGLPMCIANPIPGQEERNSDHLLERGAAIRCNNLLALSFKLENLFGNPARLESMRMAARSFGHPEAGKVIVDTCMKEWAQTQETAGPNNQNAKQKA
jgi:processive 1,2-diacylglycerol beta-glucosyltransferase